MMIRNQVRLMMICAQICVPAVIHRVDVAKVMKMNVAREVRAEVGAEAREAIKVEAERDELAALLMIDYEQH